MYILLIGLVAIVLFIYYRFKYSKKIQVSITSKVSPVDSNFNWKSQQPLKIRPFIGKTNFNPSIGLKNITSTPEDWLLIENTYLKNIKVRKSSIENNQSKVLYIHEDIKAKLALAEFFQIVCQFLLSRYPKYFKLKNGIIHNLITNESFSINESNSIEILKILGSNIEEDFLIMFKEDEDSEYRVKSSFTGFPAGFDPSINYNKTISYIHKPVPQYNKLKFSMNKFFNNIKSQNLWVRFNWSIQTHSNLFTFNNHGRPGETMKKLNRKDIDFANGCFLRNERQCFIRLPKSNALVMTIRTYLTSMENIKNEEKIGNELIFAIDNLPDDLAYYKKRHEWGDALKEYLND
ncbi:unnamed protein product [Candida verbasci]|uniref:Uncharacterized protein n=1 Tax=Candida verbasci TaxID=1227364 RepID=A0A9W4U0A8_9ASCO|nr:unnamed protein product [Candida verbasci]